MLKPGLVYTVGSGLMGNGKCWHFLDLSSIQIKLFNIYQQKLNMVIKFTSGISFNLRRIVGYIFILYYENKIQNSKFPLK